MLTPIRRIGNSVGVIIPKPLLEQVGFEKEVDLVLEEGELILRKPQRAVREGWAEASAKIADAGDDGLLMPEFANADDAGLIW